MSDREDNVYRAIPVSQPLVSQELYEKALKTAEQALALAQSTQDRNATLLEMVQAQGEAIRLRDELIKTLDAKVDDLERRRLFIPDPLSVPRQPNDYNPDPYPVWPTEPIMSCSSSAAQTVEIGANTRYAPGAKVQAQFNGAWFDTEVVRHLPANLGVSRLNPMVEVKFGGWGATLEVTPDKVRLPTTDPKTEGGGSVWSKDMHCYNTTGQFPVHPPHDRVAEPMTESGGPG